MWIVIVGVLTALILLLLFTRIRVRIRLYAPLFPIRGEVRITLLGVFRIAFPLAVMRAGTEINLLLARKKIRLYPKKKKSLIKTGWILPVLQVERVKICLREGFPTAVGTAIAYGIGQGVLAVVGGVIHHYYSEAERELEAYPSFDSEKFSLSFYCIFYVRMADIIFAVMKNQLRSGKRGKSSNREHHVFNT